MSRVRVAMVQTNSVVGDLEGNVERIRRVLDEVADCDLAVFPEMTVAGYPLEDLVLKPGFVADCRTAVEAVAEASGRCALIVGFADSAPEGGDTTGVQNAVAVCQEGRVAGVYHKRVLPNYDVFDEARHFVPGREPLQLFEIAGVRVGIVVCEDLWVADGPVGHPEVLTDHDADPHPGDLEELERLPAGHEVPRLVEHVVVGENPLVVDACDPALLADRDRVLNPGRVTALRCAVGEPDDEGAPAAGLCDRLDRRPAVGHEPRLEHQVLEGVTGDGHLRKDGQVAVGHLVEDTPDPLDVAFEVAYDRVGLHHGDPHPAHGGSVPTGPQNGRTPGRRPAGGWTPTAPL